MYISPINHYPKYNLQQRNTSFKANYYRPPEEIYNLDFYKGIEDSPHRFFSSESLKHALQNPEALGSDGLKSIGRRLFKDARLNEAEGRVYFEKAKQIQKKFKYDNKNHPDFYKYNIVVQGAPRQDAIPATELGENSDAIIGIDYYSDGRIMKLKRYKDEKIQNITYALEYNRDGKINHVEFYSSGTPKKIEIGKKNLPGGVTRADKVFNYAEDGTFISSGMDVYEHRDGKVEMSNYVFPGFFQCDPNNIQRFAIKRTENTDGTVTYQGLMVFKGKQSWCYIPEVTIQKERDPKPILSAAIRDFEKDNVKFYLCG